MTIKLARSWTAAALLAACLAGDAWAGGGVDLTALRTYVKQRDAETKLVDPDGVHRVWRSLDVKLADRASKDATRLRIVLMKLDAVSRAWNNHLAGDSQLRALLDAALDAAELKLEKAPADMSVLIGQIKLHRFQLDVLRLVTGVHSTPSKRSDENGARDFFEKGRTARDEAGDEAAQIRLWRTAARRIAVATRRAHWYINHQGGAVSQTRSAKAGHVYTVVGLGEGGFNGDGFEARRSMLYFVDECRIGPDGLLYVLDWNNHKLRRRERDGTITLVCGSGIPGDSEGDPATTDLNHPSSLVFEPTNDGTLGKIYIAAWHNHKVKVYDPTGGVDPRYAGHGPRVYTIAGTVQGGGTLLSSGDGNLATSAQFNLLPGIVRLSVDTTLGLAGDLLTADAANELIRRVALSSGSVAKNLVQTDVFTGTVTTVAGTRGLAGNAGDGGPAATCSLNFAKGQNGDSDGRMELSPDGTKMYVICGAGHCVRVIDLMTGQIDRFAGAGVAGYSGDGGPAVDAKLNRPSDIAVAPDGTVYISDSNNHVVRRVAPNGVITTYAGVGAAGPADDIASDVDVPKDAATFSYPTGLELDANGNLYVCDRQNNVIRVVTSADPGKELVLPVAPYVIPNNPKGGPPTRPSVGATGVIATYAGTGNQGFNGDGRPARETDIYWPQDVAVDPAGPNSPSHFYFVDWNNHRIRAIRDVAGTVETVLGSGLLGDQGGEGPDAKLNHPTDIAFHPVTGDLWVAAWHTDKILRIDTSGGTGHMIYMAGDKRAFSGDGFAASVPITGFDPMPTPPTTVPTPAGMAQLKFPTCVKFTANGDWYVTDEGNQRVRRVDGATDVINTILGNGTQSFAGDDGPALNATISLPIGQAAQPAGKICFSPDERWLYVCDTNNERVRRIDLTDPDRTITTFAGAGAAGYDGDDGPAIGAKLNFPCDVDCDAAGNVYIVDRDSSVIRKVVGDGLPGAGTITTFAGIGAAGYSGDGGQATAARLRQPCGIFVVRTGPAAGRVYIADTYNSVIRVVWE